MGPRDKKLQKTKKQFWPQEALNLEGVEGPGHGQLCASHWQNYIHFTTNYTLTAKDPKQRGLQESLAYTLGVYTLGV